MGPPPIFKGHNVFNGTNLTLSLPLDARCGFTHRVCLHRLIEIVKTNIFFDVSVKVTLDFPNKSLDSILSNLTIKCPEINFPHIVFKCY